MSRWEVEKRNKKTPNIVFKPYLVFHGDRIRMGNSECGRWTSRRSKRTGLWHGRQVEDSVKYYRKAGNSLGEPGRVAWNLMIMY